MATTLQIQFVKAKINALWEPHKGTMFQSAAVGEVIDFVCPAK
jgi:hypothetical protein